MELGPAPFVGYIPRAEEQRIQEQVDRVRTDGASRVVLLYGGGGVGKTRLVRALTANSANTPEVRWIPPVDVDDSNYWLLENLQRLIADELDPDQLYFDLFRTYLARLTRFGVGRVGRDTVSSHHSRMREAFVQCYRRFVESTGATVVITLDTVETIRSMYLLMSLTQLMKALPSTLFLLSGRPTRGWEDKDTITEYLEDPREGIEMVQIDLAGFGQADALAFLDASVLGDMLSTADKERVVDLTGGHPLWLTLAVDYLRQAGRPSELTSTAPVGEMVREEFRRRLVTPYRSADFWAEAIKRLAIVRHSVNERVWRDLMNDRVLPAGVDSWAEAWRMLSERPWIRPRANDRYITLHDAFAEELALRVIPLHDQDGTWRNRLWTKAAAIYTELVGSAPQDVRRQLAKIFDDEANLDDTALRHVDKLDTRKRELDQLRTARLHYLLLSDFEHGTNQFVADFSDAARHDDLQFQELACHELERFLPPVDDQKPQRDAVGVVVEQFRVWLSKRPADYLRIGLDIARFLIQNAQARPALSLLNRLPEQDADPDLRYRLANERGNACMRVPGQVAQARHYFDQAWLQANKTAPQVRDRRIAQACKELGYYSRNIGDWREADVLYERAAKQIVGVVGPDKPQAHREELASIQTNWAYLKALQGEYEQARGLVDSAMGTRRKLGRDHGIAVSLSVAGEVYRYERQFDDAWDHYKRAETMFVRLRSWPWIGLVLQEKAICLFQAHNAGTDLIAEPMKEAELLITRALDICRDQAVRWYPSALNRAGRIFGQDNPGEGLRYFADAVTEARRVSDGWFFSASLIEYLELCYRSWVDTRSLSYRTLIDNRVPDVTEAIREYRFADFRSRWQLLQAHLGVWDFLADHDDDRLQTALRRYSAGFGLLVDEQIGSHGRAALAREFDKLEFLFRLLPHKVQLTWYDTLRADWSAPQADSRSTLLLAQLERLY